jgi:hypothetical protein
MSTQESNVYKILLFQIKGRCSSALESYHL